MNGKCEREKRK